ncbi:MAG: helix-turn-helix domain-containing protein [Candidatus Thermoplasmatota archaeon]|nr:helix-turn-helix domain-containing protein [Candidatus Thermoplasmatota archaeon]
MDWNQILSDSGLAEREIAVIGALSGKSNMRASEVAKELGTTRLEAYKSLEELQDIGLVSVIADRPMRFSCPRIDKAVEHLIDIRRGQLSRIERSFNEIQSSIDKSNFVQEDTQDLENPKFTILKERVRILNRLEKMAENAEEDIVLILGKFGILPIFRGNTIQSINNAAERGVRVRILAQLDRRTIRFYRDIHGSIEVRHSDDLDAQGVLKDTSEVIQYLSSDENPVGKGKNDAALVIESSQFAESQRNLIEAIWEEAIPFETASKRYTEEKITDPLRLTLNEGSFLEKIRDVLMIEAELPEDDTPFNLEAFMASGLEISDARKKLNQGGIGSLEAFGIDITSLMRQVGNRVGQELSFSLRGVEQEIDFLNEMMDWWEHAGMGTLSYDLEPEFHIKVQFAELPEGGGLPIWALDDGIIEGALQARYPEGSDITVIREVISKEPEGLHRYNLIMS